MHYSGNIIRPPNEGDSILLQVTTGCSYNRCTFCGAYRGKRFQLKDDKIIQQDIDYITEHFREKKRLFLCDGDVVSLPTAKLINLLKEIKRRIPRIRRIGSYANARNLRKKTLEELKELKEAGLSILYMGLESGDDKTLENCNKGVTVQEQITQGQKIKEAGLKLSLTVLLGLAGPENSLEHARKTGKALSKIKPDHIGALALMVIPGTPLEEKIKARRFRLLTPRESLLELKEMIIHTNIERGLFSANHASNYLPLQFRLPGDKKKIIQTIEQGLLHEEILKPEELRGL